jgi:hypothetical protein
MNRTVDQPTNELKILDTQQVVQKISQVVLRVQVSAMGLWMGSTGHRNNILSNGSCEIGVGFAHQGNSQYKWVQNFGCRGGVYPLVINREQSITDSQSVDLYVYGDNWADE